MSYIDISGMQLTGFVTKKENGLNLEEMDG